DNTAERTLWSSPNISRSEIDKEEDREEDRFSDADTVVALPAYSSEVKRIKVRLNGSNTLHLKVDRPMPQLLLKIKELFEVQGDLLRLHDCEGFWISDINDLDNGEMYYLQ
ncbi:hypothetical protein HDU96_001858, partial [Phlyctochytrium bullatum]